MGDDCIDCGKPLPINQTMFLASRGYRCKTCEIQAQSQREAAGIVQHEVHDD